MAQYKVNITEKAINDIMEISSYISKELGYTETAEKLVERLKVAIQSLANMPKRNGLLKDEEFAVKGIRRILVDNYVIFYICSDEDLLVSVIRVLYNKRNWNDLI